MRIKEHIREHKIVYASVASGVTFAGITYVIMRGVAPQSIDHSFSVVAERSFCVLGKKIEMSNVSFISAERQGPPSWVVRCKESGEIYSSQRTAALAETVKESYLSQHLNGLQEDANGKHFERICLAA